MPWSLSPATTILPSGCTVMAYPASSLLLKSVVTFPSMSKVQAPGRGQCRTQSSKRNYQYKKQAGKPMKNFMKHVILLFVFVTDERVIFPLSDGLSGTLDGHNVFTVPEITECLLNRKH